MLFKRITEGLISGIRTAWRATGKLLRISVCFLALIGALILWAIVHDGVDSNEFNRLSPAEHLRLAKAACDISSAKPCSGYLEAERQLAAIPKSAQEYDEALSASIALKQKLARDNAAWNQKLALNRAATAQETQQAQLLSYDQMQKNISGEAHDNFTCATSTENLPIMSFDGGRFWWNDDGRCTKRQQDARDKDAEASSYISSTIRVNTDIDSTWLPDEERTCQTYPDEKGEVSIVACNGADSKRDHNIPIKFWGSVKRNTVSDWKCRREKGLLDDEFVCRAVD